MLRASALAVKSSAFLPEANTKFAVANSPVTGGHNDAVDDETLNAKEFNFDDDYDIWQDSNEQLED